MPKSKPTSITIKDDQVTLYSYLMPDDIVTIQNALKPLSGITLKISNITSMLNNTESNFFKGLYDFLAYLEGVYYQTYHDTYGLLTIGIGFNLDQFEPDYTIVRAILNSTKIDPDTVFKEDPDKKYPDGWLDGQPPKPNPSAPYPFTDKNVKDLFQASLLGNSDFKGKASELIQILSAAGLGDTTFTAAEIAALLSMSFINKQLIGPALCQALLAYKQNPTQANKLAVAVQLGNCSNLSKTTGQQNRMLRTMALFFQDPKGVTLSQFQENRITDATDEQPGMADQILPLVGFGKDYVGGQTMIGTSMVVRLLHALHQVSSKFINL